MNKTLFVSDLDGTLLDGDGRLSETTVELLNEAMEAGAQVTVATARTPATVEPLLSRLRHKTLPAIVMTGAARWDFQSKKYLDPKFISADRSEAVERIFAETDVTPFVYVLGDDGLLNAYHGGESLNKDERKFVDERRGLKLKRFMLRQTLPEKDRGRAVLYLGMGPAGQTSEIARRLREESDVAVSDYRDTYNPEVGLIEVFAPGVSKASAVKSLKEDTGAGRVVVFGDNLNDIDMMKAADAGVAVANALPEVRAVATEVIGRNTESAVARYISGSTL